MPKKVKLETGVEMSSSEFLDRLQEEIGDAETVMLPVGGKMDRITERNLNLPTRSVTDEQKTNWNALKDAMKGEYSEKFMNIMDELPAKEFMRVYLKLAEHVFPKLVRTDGSKGEVKDNRIEIVIKD